jgi:hypothetical protein
VSDHLEIEVEGADGLAAAFERAPGETAELLITVVDEGGQHLRKSGGRHGKHYPASITADTMVTEGAIYADVGPDRSRRQGGMGRGFEYGSVHTGPHPDGAAAFAANVEPFTQAVDDAVDRALHGAFG